MNRIGLFAAILFVASGSASAIDDTRENRLFQVERYIEAVPPAGLFRDIAESVAMNFPPSERASIIEFMTEFVDIEVLTNAMRDSMVRHFTADELAAIADLYSSPVGKSAMEKMGVYMADVMPVIEAEILRAVGEFQKAQAEENRLLPNE